MRLPEQAGGGRAVSYETIRRIRELGHSNIGDDTADAIATMLDVPVDQVLAAAGQRKRLGPFELPRRADRLTDQERHAVLGVVDAILDAGGKPQVSPTRGRAAAPRTRRQLEQMLARARAAGAENVGDLERLLQALDTEEADRRRA